MRRRSFLRGAVAALTGPVLGSTLLLTDRRRLRTYKELWIGGRRLDMYDADGGFSYSEEPIFLHEIEPQPFTFTISKSQTCSRCGEQATVLYGEPGADLCAPCRGRA